MFLLIVFYNNERTFLFFNLIYFTKVTAEIHNSHQGRVHQLQMVREPLEMNLFTIPGNSGAKSYNSILCQQQ